MIFILVEIAFVPTQNCDHILMLPEVFDVATVSNPLSCKWLLLLKYKLVRVLVELWEGIFCCSVRLNIVDVLLGC